MANRDLAIVPYDVANDAASTYIYGYTAADAVNLKHSNASPQEMILHESIRSLLAEVAELRDRCNVLETTNEELAQSMQKLEQAYCNEAPRAPLTKANLTGYASSEARTDDSAADAHSNRLQLIEQILWMQDKRIEELAQYKTKSSALFSALKTELDGLNVPDEVPAESARAVQPQSASDELFNGLSAHLDQLDKSLNGKIVSLEEKVSVALALASSDATPAPVQWVHEGTIEARPRRAPQQPQSGSLEKQIEASLHRNSDGRCLVSSCLFFGKVHPDFELQSSGLSAAPFSPASPVMRSMSTAGFNANAKSFTPKTQQVSECDVGRDKRYDQRCFLDDGHRAVGDPNGEKIFGTPSSGPAPSSQWRADEDGIILCQNCGCRIRERYYNCRTCGVTEDYKLCASCNEDHSCCTVLTILPEGCGNEGSQTGDGWSRPRPQQSKGGSDASSAENAAQVPPHKEQPGVWEDSGSPRVNGYPGPMFQQHDAWKGVSHGPGEQLESEAQSPRHTDRELCAAYDYLNIDPTHADRMTIERILELYKAQNPDLGPAAAEKARLALGKIGVARDSWMLVGASTAAADVHGAHWASVPAPTSLPSSVQASTYGGPRLGGKAVSLRSRQLEQAKALLKKEGPDSLLDGVDGVISAAGLPAYLNADLIDDARPTSDLKFLHRCLTTSKLVSRLAESTQSLQQVEAYGTQACCCGQDPKMPALQPLLTDLSAKLSSVEQRLSSLTSHVQIEAKLRASTSDLYDKEFFRVGQDMIITASRIDELHGELPVQAASLRGETQALSEAFAESVAAAKVQLDALETQFNMHISTYDQERKKESACDETVVENVEKMLGMADLHEATISLSEILPPNVCQLRSDLDVTKLAVEKREPSGADEKQCGPNLGAVRAVRLDTMEARLAEHDGQHCAIEQRFKTLEESVNRNVRNQLEELRVTTTSFDNVIEGANARINKLEKDFGDGFNDKRLTGLEIQAAGFAGHFEVLSATPYEDGGSKVEEGLQAIRNQLGHIRLVDLNAINARLDIGSQTKVEIVKRLDRLTARLDNIEGGPETTLLPADSSGFPQSHENDERGHVVRDYTAPISAMHRACYNCGVPGHTSHSCPESGGVTNVQCVNCDEYGHRKYQCPLPIDWSRVKCSNCGDTGHTRRNCMNPAPNAPIEESSRTAYSDQAIAGSRVNAQGYVMTDDWWAWNSRWK